MARNAAFRYLLLSLLLWQFACLDTRAADFTAPSAALPDTQDGAGSSPDGTDLMCSADRDPTRPRPNQSLDRSTLPAAEFLAGPYVHTVGITCGIAGMEMREWSAVRELVHAGDRPALHRVASSAATREGRVLGIAGLYLAGEIDERRARAMLSQLRGDVETCGGCRVSSAPADSMFGFVLSAAP
jgi:hypothetical protein